MSIGRPLEFDPAQALDQAMEAFWQRGYEATSLQDLLNTMGISKSSFYQAFESKHALFEQCLKRYRERQVQRMQAALKKASSGMAFLHDTLHSCARDAGRKDVPKGCLIMNTATEFSRRDAAVSDLVGHGTHAFTDIFRAAITRAQEEEAIPAHKDPETLARYMVSTMSGLRTMAKAGMPPEAIGAVADVALDALR